MGCMPWVLMGGRRRLRLSEYFFFSGSPAATSPNIERKKKGKDRVKDRDLDVDMPGGEEDLREEG